MSGKSTWTNSPPSPQGPELDRDAEQLAVALYQAVDEGVPISTAVLARRSGL
jgi:hypothetical protein